MIVFGRSLMSLLRHVALAAVLGFAATPAGAAPVDLLSHRAAYRLSLADSATVSGLSAVRGALVMEWRASCEGWLSTQQLGFVTETAEGPGFAYDVRFSSWESLDNRKLRFNVRSFDENGVAEEFRGQATLDGPGGQGVVAYALPPDSIVALPKGTLFPTEHVRSLIRAAEAGSTVVTHEVFDGSGPEALTRVTAVIGKAKPAAGKDAVAGQMLWPVSLAYHSVAEPDEMPQFELSFEMAPDGVLYDVTLDYGEFKLKADLEKMERFETPSCG
jgi:hypothetical protein